jgi:hypothetical protein
MSLLQFSIETACPETAVQKGFFHHQPFYTKPHRHHKNAVLGSAPMPFPVTLASIRQNRLGATERIRQPLLN